MVASSSGLRIIFFGTPDFSVPALRTCAELGQVVAVVTKPDKPAGRGQKIQEPAVKKAALGLDCTILQPDGRLRESAGFADALREVRADVSVVVAYGKILPVEILEIPKHGSINVHASILPRYRGAAPFQWAIIRGETVTGITTMQMDAGMDTGDILMVDQEPIHPDDTAASLHDRLQELGTSTLRRTLEALMDGSLTATPQKDEDATYAPMLKKEDGRLDFTQSANEVFDRVRGVTPWPGAFTLADGQILKVHAVAVAYGRGEPGEVDILEGRILVGTSKGRLEILELQKAGGRRMTSVEFLNGHSLPAKLQ